MQNPKREQLTIKVAKWEAILPLMERQTLMDLNLGRDMVGIQVVMEREEQEQGIIHPVQGMEARNQEEEVVMGQVLEEGHTEVVIQGLTLLDMEVMEGMDKVQALEVEDLDMVVQAILPEDLVQWAEVKLAAVMLTPLT